MTLLSTPERGEPAIYSHDSHHLGKGRLGFAHLVRQSGPQNHQVNGKDNLSRGISLHSKSLVPFTGPASFPALKYLVNELEEKYETGLIGL